MLSPVIDILAHWITATINYLGYGGIYVLTFLSACGIPMPTEITLPFSGFAIGSGQLHFVTVVITGVAGDLTGALLAYYIGFRGGRPLIEKFGRYVLLSKHDLNIAERWFVRYGAITTFFGRMLPVVRTYVSFPAGMSRMNVAKFIIFTTLGALPWVIGLTYIGLIMGENWTLVREKMQRFDLAIIIVIIILITLWVLRHRKHSKLVSK